MSGAVTDEELQALVRRITEAAEALIRGDIDGYVARIKHADDYTLMSPYGGDPVRGFDNSDEAWDALAHFFRGGQADVEIVETYTSGDLAVLVVIERQRGNIGDLPEQDWSLRVIWVFRRNAESEWEVVHRHADALVHPIEHERLGKLARGEWPGSMASQGRRSYARAHTPEPSITDAAFMEPSGRNRWRLSGSPTRPRSALRTSLQSRARRSRTWRRPPAFEANAVRRLHLRSGAQEIRARIVRDGTVEWSPEAAVVIAGAIRSDGDEACCGCCPVLNFFASAANAERWLAEHPEVHGEPISIPEAAAAGRAVFGDVLTAS